MFEPIKERWARQGPRGDGHGQGADQACRRRPDRQLGQEGREAQGPDKGRYEQDEIPALSRQDERPDEGRLHFLTSVLTSVSFLRSLPEPILNARPGVVMTVIEAEGVYDG